jgi:hypothetical protein
MKGRQASFPGNASNGTGSAKLYKAVHFLENWYGIKNEPQGLFHVFSRRLGLSKK